MVLIVYAIIVEVNIVTMFAAALIPGLLATVMFIAAVAIYVRLVPGSGPEGEAVSRDELVAATLAMVPVLVIFAVVIGGIYAGIYSPTAAAAIGVVLVVLYGVGRRRLTRRGDARRAARDGADQRHDLPDPARGGAAEDLHVARRGAAGGGRVAAGRAGSGRWRSWC